MATKKQTLLQLLEQGLTTIVVDATDPAVTVPERFWDNTKLVLNLSTKFPEQILISDFGIITKLSFGGRKTTCAIPWLAISAMYLKGGGSGVVWAAEVPNEEVKALMDQVMSIVRGDRHAT